MAEEPEQNEIFSSPQRGAPVAAPTAPATRQCQECGQPYTASRKAARFCGSACNAKFQNRRSQRGAMLYDLYMAHRFERPAAQRRGVLKVMNRLASNWRNEDHVKIDGRKSWGDWQEFLSTRLDLSLAIRLPTFGRRRRG